MKDVLIHTSDVRTDILKPDVYLSLNCYMPCFGEYVYLFEKEMLEENFRVFRCPTGGMIFEERVFNKRYRYESQSLQWEYIIKEPINVNRFAINVIELFSTMKGKLETWLEDEIVKKEFIDLSSRSM